MQTRATPTGYQHYLDLTLRHAPDTRFTDPVRALADLEGGLAQPLAEVIEHHADGSVLVRLSVFSDCREVSPDETAAVEGLKAELKFVDGKSE